MGASAQLTLLFPYRYIFVVNLCVLRHIGQFNDLRAAGRPEADARKH